MTPPSTTAAADRATPLAADVAAILQAPRSREIESLDLVCLTHLRWNWVYQRPQHLMTRAARDHRVFLFEEAMRADGPPRLEVQQPKDNIWVATPYVPPGLSDEAVNELQRRLLDGFLAAHGVHRYILWYYTPMALAFSDHLAPTTIVFDCMDELSAFAGAPAKLRDLEVALLQRANVVFTGGLSLYEAKRALHPNVHAFPSSVDVAHFAQARHDHVDPSDQRDIPHPRIGYCGVIDERIDYDLLNGLAVARPDWHIVMVGPITKVDPSILVAAPNLHLLGAKNYDELPRYIGGWDVAMLPFAHNESTRFISPTKTPEYLAAGRHVVSTSIRDVVRTYGDSGLVRIADGVSQFVSAIEASVRDEAADRLARIDQLLRDQSWDTTWQRMLQLLTLTTATRAEQVYDV